MLGVIMIFSFFQRQKNQFDQIIIAPVCRNCSGKLHFALEAAHLVVGHEMRLAGVMILVE